MGDETVGAAVADAGPIIHLAEIGCSALLRIFDPLHIPDTVWAETVGQHRVSQNNIEGDNVQRHTLPPSGLAPFIQEHSLQDLQAGEQECLYLCKQIDVSVLLTDDLSVRETSKRLDLTPVGSLGIVVRAYRKGQIVIEEAERHIANLYDVSSLFVTRAIVGLAIEQLRRFSNNSASD